MKFSGLAIMAIVLLPTTRALAQRAPAATPQAIPPTADSYKKIAAEVQNNLKTEILAKWYPAAMDEKNGGFFQNYTEDWKPGRANGKAIVYESRLTWTAAQAASRFPDQADMYTKAAKLGLDFLANKMWDQTNGGFYWMVNDDGSPNTRATNSFKQEYGNGFAIYAAAAVYKLTKDPAALDLAKKGFQWWDQHAHDAKNGGYVEILTVDGKPALDTMPAVGGPSAGLKSMNSSIHMLEALTSLYEIWPDPTVKARLQEMFELNRDKIYTEPGYLTLFFTQDWKPVPQTEDSYGHDVETSYLLAEAAAALGIPDDAKTWEVGKKLVDHALAVGWDKTHGGLFNSGGINGGNYAGSREWWVEAEWVNALLLMHDKYGKDDPKYWNTFVAQWNWIQKYEIDPVNGGWWPRVNNDGTPVHQAKSDAWTECYHQGRAMMNVEDRLLKLAADAK